MYLCIINDNDMKQKIEIREGLFLVQPTESFSFHVTMDGLGRVLETERSWGKLPVNMYQFMYRINQMELITLDEKSSKNVITICVWEIDDNGELFLEVYHRNEGMDKFDRIVKYDTFLEYQYE